MTQRPDAPPALAAAQLHLQATHAALAAALRQEADADADADTDAKAAIDDEAPAGRDGSASAGAGLLRQSLVVQLAEHAVAPWAEQRPWTLMAVAAGAGALLASRMGRGMLGSLAMAALLAPAPGRRTLQPLAAGLAFLLRRRSGPPPR
jgi:ElaB/YqjD/DUF883 family membrane-anchored ribosome-binding protein